MDEESNEGEIEKEKIVEELIDLELDPNIDIPPYLRKKEIYP